MSMTNQVAVTSLSVLLAYGRDGKSINLTPAECEALDLAIFNTKMFAYFEEKSAQQKGQDSLC